MPVRRQEYIIHTIYYYAQEVPVASCLHPTDVSQNCASRAFSDCIGFLNVRVYIAGRLSRVQFL